MSPRVTAAELASCQTALQQDGSRRDVFERLVQVLLSSGRYQEVVHWSHEVLSRDESRTDAIYFLAVGLRKLSRCPDAVAFYRLYATRQPKDPDPHYAIGLCLESMGRLTAARQAYGQYLELETRPAYQRWRAEARSRLATLGKPSAKTVAHQSSPETTRSTPPAAAPAKAAAPKRRTPAPPAAHAAAPATAAAPAATAIAVRPSQPAAPANRSAVDCAAPAETIAKDPFAVGAYDQLAGCLRAQGQHQKVVRLMRTALRDNPEWSRGWLHLGTAQRALGETQKAKSALRKACEGGVAEAC